MYWDFVAIDGVIKNQLVQLFLFKHDLVMDWKLVEVKQLLEGIEKNHSNPNWGPGWDSNQARPEQSSRALPLDKPALKPDVLLFCSRISWGMSQGPLAGHVASYLLVAEIKWRTVRYVSQSGRQVTRGTDREKRKRDPTGVLLGGPSSIWEENASSFSHLRPPYYLLKIFSVQTYWKGYCGRRYNGRITRGLLLILKTLSWKDWREL
jgi:hypothetical protein